MSKKNEEVENNIGKKRKREKDEQEDKSEDTTETNDPTTEIQIVELKPIEIKREFVKLNSKLDTLDDLIKLANQYDSSKDYNINLKKLHKILPSLEKLKNIIGMKSVKDSIVGQIVFFLNEFNEQNQDMLHTIIQGPPGVGKTTLGKIIGELYYYLDIIKPVNSKPKKNPNKKIKLITFEELLNLDLDSYMENRVDDCCNEPKVEEKKDEFKFKIVKRSDMVGRYLGETSIKTTDAIKSCEGGVMFIDEAYSLGNPEGRDSFAKECIDTINQHLSEEKCNLLCIIAGYKDALDKCFFSYNEGLRRRFPFVYTIEKYTPEELCLIYKKMVKDMGWIADNVPEKFFIDNHECFENSGGDIETLFFMTKINHGKRTLFLPEERKKINIEDLENAFKVFKINKELKGDKDDDKNAAWRSMYT
jgi:DNA polymerase III delta prime subunit